MDIVTALLIGIAGLALGFALNPLITKLATDPKAANPLQPARYALLGGPAWQGVVVALLMGGMAVALYRHLGLVWQFGYWLAMAAVIIVTGAVDWKVRLIDVLVLLGAVIAALVAAPFNGVGLRSALLGCVVAGIVFVFFFFLAQVMFPGPGVPFGLGDVYLAMYIGALVGVGHLGGSLFYGMVLAGVASLVVLARRQMGQETALYISYGTYLCLGLLLYLALWLPDIVG